MDWIKNNYEKFTLLLLSVVLIAASAYLVWDAHNFMATFEGIVDRGTHSNKVAPLETKNLIAAKGSLEKPAKWVSNKGRLFVSEQYILKDDMLICVTDDKGGMIHPPVPNNWFAANNLEIANENILSEDPDGDGFTNLDEFLGHTNPNDKNSHPPYTTKLRLVKFIQQPFRLMFKSRPDNDSFQIDTVDVKQPTQILKLGDQIAGTKFKIIDFKEKKFTNPSTDAEQDVSELTIENNETKEKVVLILEKLVNSPDSYAQFRYLWDNTDIKVKKDKEFSLKPEDSVKYKVVDIQDAEATIENVSTHEQIKVPHLDEQK
jgi:hypothetical protein